MSVMEKTRNLLMSIPVAAGVNIPEGVIVGINADGYAVEATKMTGLKIAGVAREYADNGKGAAGDACILVKRGAFLMNRDGTIKTTDLLKQCYVLDSSTVTLTADGASEAGKILQVEDNGVTVDIM